ncbi:hypothetical protein [Streptomyces sp. NPDC050485]|uniref:hypothetical protein n=1 Tax=Streptomyces sp. NPDC050485 TaxID=3365617 RepID=UPI0037B30224
MGEVDGDGFDADDGGCGEGGADDGGAGDLQFVVELLLGVGHGVGVLVDSRGQVSAVDEVLEPALLVPV